MTLNRAETQARKLLLSLGLTRYVAEESVELLAEAFKSYAAAEVDAAVQLERDAARKERSRMTREIVDAMLEKDKAVDAAVRAERERCLSAVDNEPENPGKMPDEMWEAISRDRDACEKAFQINTALTKRNISQSIRLSKLEKESK